MCGSKPPGLFRRRPGSSSANTSRCNVWTGLHRGNLLLPVQQLSAHLKPFLPPPHLNEFPQPRCDLLQPRRSCSFFSSPSRAERERSEETGLDKLCAVCEFDAESKSASVRQEKPQFSRKASQSHTYGPEEGNSESVSRHKSGSDRSR